VEKVVLEIAGLEARSGLIIADFTEKEHSLPDALLRREMRSLRPPLPVGKTCCLAVIMGETG
jgi:hypothetical protein